VRRDDTAERLLVALEHRDELALAGILRPDVRLLVDAGDETGGQWRGRVRVGDILRTRLARHPTASLETVHVNGGPGLALRRDDGVVIGVLAIGVDPARSDGEVGELWLSTAAAKLARWNRARPTG
jgi:hypothetical protein